MFVWLFPTTQLKMVSPDVSGPPRPFRSRALPWQRARRGCGSCLGGPFVEVGFRGNQKGTSAFN